MPKFTNIPYLCPRCGYSTAKKTNIKNHFFQKKKPCPASVNELELTEEIMNHVLDNRTYKIVDEAKTVNQVINQYNQLNNFIGNMDHYDKLEEMLNYRGAKTIGFGDKVEQRHEREISRLDTNRYKYGIEFGQDRILDILDQSIQAKPERIEEINVLFNQKLNKISMFHDDQWYSYMMETGSKEIIRIVKDYLLVSYEKFILRKLFHPTHAANAYDRAQYELQLTDYYEFLAIFDLYPYIYGRDNSEIIDCEISENGHFIEDFGMKLYQEKKSELSKSKINRTKKQVVDIIKRNSSFNIENLNKDIVKIINTDDSFKEKLIKGIN
jgi:hypothetical protein